MSSSKKSKSASVKSTKEEPNLELTCKFRGRYDLRKNKLNKEIDLDNAVGIFEAIQKKNAKLYQDSHIKMFSEKKTFSFCNQKSFSKVHHHIPYIEVKKFFVLHKDPTMVIMGIHHKNNRWFFVFQFASKEDLTTFCDEIEFENRKTSVIENPLIDNDEPMTVDVPDSAVEKYERLSIHSKVYEDHLKAEEINFEDSYYEPDLKPEHFSVLELNSPRSGSSRASSRNSLDGDFANIIHCNNISQSRIKDLLLQQESVFNDDNEGWEENLTFFESPNDISIPHINDTGPIYMYLARHRVNYLRDMWDNKVDRVPFAPVNQRENFESFKPKMFKNEMEPNDIQKKRYSDLKMNDADTFVNHQPKINGGGGGADNFLNHEPKVINQENGLDTFRNHEPKMNGPSNDPDNFKSHEPKLIFNGENADTFNNHVPKMNKGLNPRTGNESDTFLSHDPKMIQQCL